MEGEYFDAGYVFLLLGDTIFPNKRDCSLWLLNHLDEIVTPCHPHAATYSASQRMEVLSVIPSHYTLAHCDMASQPCRVVCTTKVVFLARRYRIVFSLDTSPSAFTINTSAAHTVADDIKSVLKRSLSALLRPFQVPGTRIVLRPILVISVIGQSAYRKMSYSPEDTEGVMSPTQSMRVLVHGVALTEHNLSQTLRKVEHELNKYENILVEEANASKESAGPGLDSEYPYTQLHTQPPTRPQGNTDLHTLTAGKTQASRVHARGMHTLSGEMKGASAGVHKTTAMEAVGGMSKPEQSSYAGLVSSLQNGIFALEMLPGNYKGTLIVLTDGVATLRDHSSAAFDSILTLFSRYMFPLSFIQVTNYEPSMSFGYVPDTELLQFASKATNGAFLFTSDCVSLPAPSPDSYPAQRVWAVEDGVWDQYDSLTKNIYHAAFTASTFSSSPVKQYDESRDQGRKCSVTIPLFEGVQDSNPWETYQPNQAAHTRTLLVDSTHKYNHMTPLRSSFPWTDAPPPPVSVFRRLCKRYSLQIGLAEVVSLRVKEGYVITNITKASETSPKTTQNASDSGIDTDTKSKTEPHPPITVVCSLAWKQFCNIEYHITGQRPLHTHSSSQIDTPTATAPSTDGIYSQTSFSSHAGSETPNTGAHVPTSTSTPTSRSTGTHTSTRTGIGTDAHTSPDASEHSRESTHEDSVGNTQARVSNDGPVEGLGSEAQATEDKDNSTTNKDPQVDLTRCQVQIYIVGPYKFVKAFTALQKGQGKAILFDKGYNTNLTTTAAVKLHQFTSGQREADRLLVRLHAFLYIPLLSKVPTAAAITGVFSLVKRMQEGSMYRDGTGASRSAMQTARPQDNSDSSAYLLTEDIGASHTPVTGARGTNTTTAQSEIEINQGLGHIEAGFLEYWRAVVAIGTASWERWLDCDRLAMTLIPDHTPNVDRSYVHKLNLKLTYKTATAVVTTVATEWASMVLIEGHTYVRFIDIEAMTRDATCQREKDEDIALVHANTYTPLATSMEYRTTTPALGNTAEENATKTGATRSSSSTPVHMSPPLSRRERHSESPNLSYLNPGASQTGTEYNISQSTSASAPTSNHSATTEQPIATASSGTSDRAFCLLRLGWESPCILVVRLGFLNTPTWVRRIVRTDLEAKFTSEERAVHTGTPITSTAYRTTMHPQPQVPGQLQPRNGSTMHLIDTPASAIPLPLTGVSAEIAQITSVQGNAVSRKPSHRLSLGHSAHNANSLPTHDETSAYLTFYHKPLRRMLVVYERSGLDESASILPNLHPPPSVDSSLPSLNNSPVASKQRLGVDRRRHTLQHHMSLRFKPRSLKSTPISILGLFLIHRRWVWMMPPESERSSLIPLSSTLVQESILKERLKEGFQVLMSDNGVHLLALEVTMVQAAHENGIDADTLSNVPGMPGEEAHVHTNARGEGSCADGKRTTCVLQFMVFPQPKHNKVVTELWLDPQAGTIVGCHGNLAYLNGASYQDAHPLMHAKDQCLVSSLLMFDYIYSQISRGLPLVTERHRARTQSSSAANVAHEAAEQNVPFTFDVDKLLLSGMRCLLTLPVLEEDSHQHTHQHAHTYTLMPTRTHNGHSHEYGYSHTHNLGRVGSPSAGLPSGDSDGTSGNRVSHVARYIRDGYQTVVEETGQFIRHPPTGHRLSPILLQEGESETLTHTHTFPSMYTHTRKQSHPHTAHVHTDLHAHAPMYTPPIDEMREALGGAASAEMPQMDSREQSKNRTNTCALPMLSDTNAALQESLSQAVAHMCETEIELSDAETTRLFEFFYRYKRHLNELEHQRGEHDHFRNTPTPAHAPMYTHTHTHTYTHTHTHQATYMNAQTGAHTNTHTPTAATDESLHPSTYTTEHVQARTPTVKASEEATSETASTHASHQHHTHPHVSKDIHSNTQQRASMDGSTSVSDDEGLQFVSKDGEMDTASMTERGDESKDRDAGTDRYTHTPEYLEEEALRGNSPDAQDDIDCGACLVVLPYDFRCFVKTFDDTVFVLAIIPLYNGVSLSCNGEAQSGSECHGHSDEDTLRHHSSFPSLLDGGRRSSSRLDTEYPLPSNQDLFTGKVASVKHLEIYLHECARGAFELDMEYESPEHMVQSWVAGVSRQPLNVPLDPYDGVSEPLEKLSQQIASARESILVQGLYSCLLRGLSVSAQNVASLSVSCSQTWRDIEITGLYKAVTQMVDDSEIDEMSQQFSTLFRQIVEWDYAAVPDNDTYFYLRQDPTETSDDASHETHPAQVKGPVPNKGHGPGESDGHRNGGRKRGAQPPLFVTIVCIAKPNPRTPASSAAASPSPPATPDHPPAHTPPLSPTSTARDANAPGSGFGDGYINEVKVAPTLSSSVQDCLSRTSTDPVNARAEHVSAVGAGPSPKPDLGPGEGVRKPTPPPLPVTRASSLAHPTADPDTHSPSTGPPASSHVPLDNTLRACSTAPTPPCNPLSRPHSTQLLSALAPVAESGPQTQPVPTEARFFVLNNTLTDLFEYLQELELQYLEQDVSVWLRVACHFPLSREGEPPPSPNQTPSFNANNAPAPLRSQISEPLLSAEPSYFTDSTSQNISGHSSRNLSRNEMGLKRQESIKTPDVLNYLDFWSNFSSDDTDGDSELSEADEQGAGRIDSEDNRRPRETQQEHCSTILRMAQRIKWLCEDERVSLLRRKLQARGSTGPGSGPGSGATHTKRTSTPTHPTPALTAVPMQAGEADDSGGGNSGGGPMGKEGYPHVMAGERDTHRQAADTKTGPADELSTGGLVTNIDTKSVVDPALSRNTSSSHSLNGNTDLSYSTQSLARAHVGHSAGVLSWGAGEEPVVTTEALQGVIKHITSRRSRQSPLCISTEVPIDFVNANGAELFGRQLHMLSVKGYDLVLARPETPQADTYTNEMGPMGNLSANRTAENGSEGALSNILSKRNSASTGLLNEAYQRLRGEQWGAMDTSQEEYPLYCFVDSSEPTSHRHAAENFWGVVRLRENSVELLYHAALQDIIHVTVDAMGEHDANPTTRTDIAQQLESQGRLTAQIRQRDEFILAAVGAMKALSHRVNQELLLDELNEFRFCSSILMSTVFDGTHYSLAQFEEDEESDPHRQRIENDPDAINSFACPLVYYRHIPVHWRVNMSTALGSAWSVLQPFGVSNRRGMFVYREVSGRVFYLVVNEGNCGKENTDHHTPATSGRGSARTSSAPSTPLVPTDSATSLVNLPTHSSAATGDSTQLRPHTGRHLHTLSNNSLTHPLPRTSTPTHEHGHTHTHAHTNLLTSHRKLEQTWSTPAPSYAATAHAPASRAMDVTHSHTQLATTTGGVGGSSSSTFAHKHSTCGLLQTQAHTGTHTNTHTSTHTQKHLHQPGSGLGPEGHAQDQARVTHSQILTHSQARAHSPLPLRKNILATMTTPALGSVGGLGLGGGSGSGTNSEAVGTSSNTAADLRARAVTPDGKHTLMSGAAEGNTGTQPQPHHGERTNSRPKSNQDEAHTSTDTSTQATLEGADMNSIRSRSGSSSAPPPNSLPGASGQAAGDDQCCNVRNVNNCLSVSVYGVDIPGAEVQTELVSMLVGRLRTVALGMISELLERNPTLRLTNEDLAYIHPPEMSKEAVVWLPLEVTDVFTFMLFWRQNMLQFLNNLIGPDTVLGTIEPAFSDRSKSLATGAGALGSVGLAGSSMNLSARSLSNFSYSRKASIFSAPPAGIQRAHLETHQYTHQEVPAHSAAADSDENDNPACSKYGDFHLPPTATLNEDDFTFVYNAQAQPNPNAIRKKIGTVMASRLAALKASLVDRAGNKITDPPRGQPMPPVCTVEAVQAEDLPETFNGELAADANRTPINSDTHTAAPSGEHTQRESPSETAELFTASTVLLQQPMRQPVAEPSPPISRAVTPTQPQPSTPRAIPNEHHSHAPEHTHAPHHAHMQVSQTGSSGDGPSADRDTLSGGTTDAPAPAPAPERDALGHMSSAPVDSRGGAQGQGQPEDKRVLTETQSQDTAIGLHREHSIASNALLAHIPNVGVYSRSDSAMEDQASSLKQSISAMDSVRMSMSSHDTLSLSMGPSSPYSYPVESMMKNGGAVISDGGYNQEVSSDETQGTLQPSSSWPTISHHAIDGVYDRVTMATTVQSLLPDDDEAIGMRVSRGEHMSPHAPRTTDTHSDALKDTPEVAATSQSTAGQSESEIGGQFGIKLRVWTPGPAAESALLAQIAARTNQAIVEYLMEKTCESVPVVLDEACEAVETGDHADALDDGCERCKATCGFEEYITLHSPSSTKAGARDSQHATTRETGQQERTQGRSAESARVTLPRLNPVYQNSVATAVARGWGLGGRSMNVHHSKVVIPRWAMTATLSEIIRILEKTLPLVTALCFRSCGHSTPNNRKQRRHDQLRYRDRQPHTRRPGKGSQDIGDRPAYLYHPVVPNPCSSTANDYRPVPPSPSSATTYTIIATNASDVCALADTQTFEHAHAQAQDKQDHAHTQAHTQAQAQAKAYARDGVIAAHERVMLHPSLRVWVNAANAGASGVATAGGSTSIRGRPSNGSVAGRPRTATDTGEIVFSSGMVDDNGTPLGSNITPEDESVLVPRHFLVACHVQPSGVYLYFYNIEVSIRSAMTRSIIQALSWQCNRNHLLISILHQKMGLFHHLSQELPLPATPEAADDAREQWGVSNREHLGPNRVPLGTTSATASYDSKDEDTSTAKSGGDPTPQAATATAKPSMPTASMNNSVSVTSVDGLLVPLGNKSTPTPVLMSRAPKKIRLNMVIAPHLMFHVMPSRNGIWNKTTSHPSAYNSHNTSGATSPLPGFTRLYSADDGLSSTPNPAMINYKAVVQAAVGPYLSRRLPPSRSQSPMFKRRTTKRGERSGPVPSVTQTQAVAAFSSVFQYGYPHESLATVLAPFTPGDPVLRHGVQFFHTVINLREKSGPLLDMLGVCESINHPPNHESSDSLFSPSIIATASKSSETAIHKSTAARLPSNLSVLPHNLSPMYGGNVPTGPLPHESLRFAHFCRTKVLLPAREVGTSSHNRQSVGKSGSAHRDVRLQFLTEYSAYLSRTAKLQVIGEVRHTSATESVLIMLKCVPQGVFQVEITLKNDWVSVDVYCMWLSLADARDVIPLALLPDASPAIHRLCAGSHRPQSDTRVRCYQQFAMERAMLNHTLHIKSYVYDAHVRYIHNHLCEQAMRQEEKAAYTGKRARTGGREKHADKAKSSATHSQFSDDTVEHVAQLIAISPAPPTFARNRMFVGNVNIEMDSTLLCTHKFLRYMLSRAPWYGFQSTKRTIDRCKDAACETVLFVTSHEPTFECLRESRVSMAVPRPNPSHSTPLSECDTNTTYTLVVWAPSVESDSAEVSDTEEEKEEPSPLQAASPDRKGPRTSSALPATIRIRKPQIIPVGHGVVPPVTYIPSPPDNLERFLGSSVEIPTKAQAPSRSRPKRLTTLPAGHTHVAQERMQDTSTIAEASSTRTLAIPHSASQLTYPLPQEPILAHTPTYGIAETRSYTHTNTAARGGHAHTYDATHAHAHAHAHAHGSSISANAGVASVTALGVAIDRLHTTTPLHTHETRSPTPTLAQPERQGLTVAIPTSPRRTAQLGVEGTGPPRTTSPMSDRLQSRAINVPSPVAAASSDENADITERLNNRYDSDYGSFNTFFGMGKAMDTETGLAYISEREAMRIPPQAFGGSVQPEGFFTGSLLSQSPECLSEHPASAATSTLDLQYAFLVTSTNHDPAVSHEDAADVQRRMPTRRDIHRNMRGRLESLVHTATEDCKRDVLWDAFVQPITGKTVPELQVTIGDLMQLQKLVHTRVLSEEKPVLKELLRTNVSWNDVTKYIRRATDSQILIFYSDGKRKKSTSTLNTNPASRQSSSTNSIAATAVNIFQSALSNMSAHSSNTFISTGTNNSTGWGLGTSTRRQVPSEGVVVSGSSRSDSTNTIGSTGGSWVLETDVATANDSQTWLGSDNNSSCTLDLDQPDGYSESGSLQGVGVSDVTNVVVLHPTNRDVMLHLDLHPETAGIASEACHPELLLHTRENEMCDEKMALRLEAIDELAAAVVNSMCTYVWSQMM